jgi:uncharacterized damage-inducible protein DinB
MQVNVNVNKEDIGRGKPRNHRRRAIAGAFKRLGEPMRTLLICLLAPAALVLAQDKPATVASTQDKPAAAASAQDNPLSGFNKRAYGQLKVWLLRSAEKMPEENYSFKPTEAVRSFGQILGHVADAQYMFCSVVLGEKNPALNIEKSKTSKADLIKALKDAFAYGDKAYDGMTDASAIQMVKLFGGDTPKLSVLTVNIAHTAEHYGNLITYLRLKNIVPPSSEPAAPAPPKK